MKESIQKAFVDAVYPGDDDLVVSRSRRDPECQEIAEAFRSKEWRDIGVEMLRDQAEALPLLSPAAFRYYLPAYMIGYLESPLEVNVVPDSLVFNLTPPRQRSGWEWEFFWTRVQGFTVQQREAIKSFLQFMQEYERSGWVSAGEEPPEDRVGPALSFWEELARM